MSRHNQNHNQGRKRRSNTDDYERESGRFFAPPNPPQSNNYGRNGGQNQQYSRNDQQYRNGGQNQQYRNDQQYRNGGQNRYDNRNGGQGNRLDNNYPRYPMESHIFVPPPPMPPPLFGNGRRSFQDYSFPGNNTMDDSYVSTSTVYPTEGGSKDEPIELSDGELGMEEDDEERQQNEGEHEDEIEQALNEALGLRSGQVPDYVLRMRDMGPRGYPPALIDEHVLVRNSLPFFFGPLDDVLPKRKLCRETLPAFRGYTHQEGTIVSEGFLKLMERAAEIDRVHSRQAALERSGLEEFANDSVTVEEDGMDVKKAVEIIRYEVPEHEASGSGEYLFGSETSTMKHTLGGFAEGIQPFEHSHINKPTFFMSKLKNILGKKKPENGEAEVKEVKEIEEIQEIQESIEE